jgi:hypothetical protein
VRFECAVCAVCVMCVRYRSSIRTHRTPNRIKCTCMQCVWRVVYGECVVCEVRAVCALHVRSMCGVCAVYARCVLCVVRAVRVECAVCIFTRVRRVRFELVLGDLMCGLVCAVWFVRCVRCGRCANGVCCV